MNNYSDLKVALLKSCFASPIRNVLLSEKNSYSKSVNRIGGFYDMNNEPYLDSLLQRTAANHIFLQAHDKSYIINRDEADYVKGKAIYGGIITSHYGHFLVETLARTWYINKDSSDVYFYTIQGGKNKGTYEELTQWQKEILVALVGTEDRIKIISRATVFDELLIPEPGCVTRNFLAKNHIEALAELGSRITAGSDSPLLTDKVWLSRSSLRKGGVAGEKKFEETLANEGFTIIHPEKLPLAQQIKVFENASVVAGFVGSAFHTLLLARNKGAKLLHFSREKHINNNYLLCAKASGFKAEFYNFFIRFGEIKGANGFVLHDLSSIWNVLYEQGLVQAKEYFDPDMEQDLLRLDDELKKRLPRFLLRGGSTPK
jgi:capsular polysaccharide biosynthesis protein